MAVCSGCSLNAQFLGRFFWVHPHPTSQDTGFVCGKGLPNWGGCGRVWDSKINLLLPAGAPYAVLLATQHRPSPTSWPVRTCWMVGSRSGPSGPSCSCSSRFWGQTQPAVPGLKTHSLRVGL